MASMPSIVAVAVVEESLVSRPQPMEVDKDPPSEGKKTPASMEALKRVP
jgi:hypothetical protein